MVPPATLAQRSTLDSELAAPIAVYVYQPVSGAPPAALSLSEDRALHDIEQLVRLKKSGLRVDYDLLEASALAPDGLHPAGRMSAWPHGPAPWIARCRAAGIHPGIHFAASAFRPDGRAAALDDGQFLPDFVATLQSWYDRGIRLFAFDAPDLAAAPAGTATALSRDRIVARNAAAFRTALTAFRAKNRGVVLLAIESDVAQPSNSAHSSSASESPAGNGELRDEASPGVTSRLGAFLLFATGPPQPSGMPQASLQHAIDIETDGRVRRDEQERVPLAHILSAGFIQAPEGAGSLDGPGPARGLPRGWRGAFLLSMARGGWVDLLSGSLDSIGSGDARWMARVQRLFFAMQAEGQMHSFGGPPSSGQPYGFTGATSRGAVDVFVNPTQAVATLPLPSGPPPGSGRVLFCDAGFAPQLTGSAIVLGPGQLAAVGFGAYAAPKFNLGIEHDVVIPSSIERVDAEFHVTAPGVLEARIDPPIQGVLRVIVRESAPGPEASDGNSQASAASYNHRLTLKITQGGRPIPLRPNGAGSDGAGTLNAGLSWAVAEVDVNDLTPGIPVRVLFRCDEKSAVILDGSAYQVIY